MTRLLKGAAVATAINEASIKTVKALKAKGVTPCLAVVRVGTRGDDIAYETSVVGKCAALGISTRPIALADSIDTEALLREIHGINRDAAIHGVLLFRPLPKQIDETRIRNALDERKDIDGIGDRSLARVFTDGAGGFAPCTAQAVVELLEHYAIDVAGKNAVVVGRSLVIGKPVAMLLLRKNATVTLCHSRTENLAAIAQGADILIAALGRANRIDRACLSERQTVIDVGINVDAEGKLCGDVKREDAEDFVFAMAPVPGGIGAVTTAVLIKNLLTAAGREAGL